MEFYIRVIFAITLLETVCRVINIYTGAWKKPARIGVYNADTILAATLMLWAGFLIWYS